MTERWLPVVGYEGLYEVSDHGRVRSVDRVLRHHCGPTATGREATMLRRGELMRQSPNNWGYPKVILSKNGRQRCFKVHRLVLTAFRGPPPEDDMQAAHWDGDAGNARLDNLRWATREQNRGDDCRRHGRTNQVITDLEAQLVHQFRGWFRNADFAQALGCHQATISRIQRGVRRGYLLKEASHPIPG